MTEPVLNQEVVEELLAHCEDATERELVPTLRQAGFTGAIDLLTSTIRMAAATGAKQMFLQLGDRGFLRPPPLPSCPTCGEALSNVNGDFSAAKRHGPGVTVPCGHHVVATIQADGRIDLVAA